MKRVVFSGSIKYYTEMKVWADYLKNNKIKADLPQLTDISRDFEKLKLEDKRTYKFSFIKDHNKKIDETDILFIFNFEGYVGNSVTLEIGYALAKGKSIYAMQKDTELGRDVLYDGYCSTPDELLAILTA